MKLKNVIQIAIAFTFIFVGLKVVSLKWFINAYVKSNSNDETLSNWNSLDNPISSSTNHSSLDRNLLLYWGRRWNNDPWPPEGHRMDNCVVTYNRSKILKAKAVIFHSTTLHVDDFPWKFDRFVGCCSLISS